MPQFQDRRTLAALEKNVNLFSQWQYRYLPYRALVRLGVWCTGAAAGQDMAVFTGSQNVVQQGAISVGATDGAIPTTFDVPYMEFIGDAGDEISTKINELGNVATTDVMFFVAIDPI